MNSSLTNNDLKQNRYKQEQNIKKRLYMIDFQESNRPQYRTTNYFLNPNHMKRKQSDFKDLSDWYSSSFINKQDPQISNNQQEKNMTSRNFNVFNKTRYPSALLSYKSQDKKQRSIINPMIVKFNANILSQNLDAAKQNFMKKLKQDLYLKHYKNKGIIFDRLSRRKKQKQLRNTQLQLSSLNKTSENSQFSPKKQRASAIIRLLKMRQTSKLKRDLDEQAWKISPEIKVNKKL